ncbi:hypothetical protein [Pseudoclavibacter sp. AY1H1]|uniref:hypothetical protein n=1 Tax=Pseudoclavibacter sp. AY1H1 TaxID=2080584 RepID=UPI000CE8B5B9|nr:hypothetical protein [Pseudoclavibacter sp. AY1H1]PPF33590.1 hypothetical protein C5E05_17290 [Pseudoclavibacter sp. AY1H1]
MHNTTHKTTILRLAFAASLGFSLLAVTGCTTETPESQAPTASSAAHRSPASTPPASVTPTSEAAETTNGEFGPVETNDRGNLVKQIGQLAGLTSSKKDDISVAKFVVTDIIPNYTCDAPYSSTPASGQYVALQMNVETMPELVSEPYPSVSFSEWAWQAYDAEGKRVNDVMGNGYSCMDQAQRLPGEIGPGQSVSGYVVLDVPIGTSSVVLAPHAPTGWEWAVPTS